MSFDNRVRKEALGAQVLAVSSANYVDGTDELFDWCAYIDAVPGMDHNIEWLEVKRHGSKLPAKVAAAIFPGLDIKKYRL